MVRMVRIVPLPGSLVQTPFTVYESRALGVRPKRLRAHDLSDGGRLIYLPAGRHLDIAERARVLAAATPGAWVSHETAAVLTSLGLPPWMGECPTIHLSKPHELPRVRRAGVTGHRVVHPRRADRGRRHPGHRTTPDLAGSGGGTAAQLPHCPGRPA